MMSEVARAGAASQIAACRAEAAAGVPMAARLFLTVIAVLAIVTVALFLLRPVAG